MSSFMDLCFRIPNLGTLAFIVIFILVIPLLLFVNNSTDTFKYYLPFLVMLAITFTEAGKPNNFVNLYPEKPENVTGFMTRNLINALALVGLLLQCITVSVYYNNIQIGVLIGVISFSITFAVAQQVLPFFIREGSRTIEENTNFKYPGNWHKYFIGFSFIIFLLGLEYILMLTVSDFVFGNKKGNNNNSNNNMFNNTNINKLNNNAFNNNLASYNTTK